MAYPLNSGSVNPSTLRLVLILMSTCLGVYLLGPPLYWYFAEGAFASTSCSPCRCDCSSEAIFSMPQGFGNSSFADCGKNDPNVSEEMEKSFTDLLAEELKLQELVASENKRHADAALLEAKKVSSQYQKEADKCNAGMETCEGAREKAEAALIAERKLSALWEMRARERGWNGSETTNR
ncbi:uncharacterized protein LOC18440647 isoform X1 [Amborella trichopoda]|uniref:uncharacterized protein LOC18440647 isoform X1 n=1 Tax=Amborella trichopoda TaxID=13333 RepID=UPI0005D45C88|nr:uncharacterized protein LOC18440647 isoform X1 [Amborella trichopoda]|eukprot:XP_011625712.1 uncharacterized protein LOC18440647 isoform X1 [Amborella trichopoda]